jgi:hypothetical protein
MIELESKNEEKFRSPWKTRKKKSKDEAWKLKIERKESKNWR